MRSPLSASGECEEDTKVGAPDVEFCLTASECGSEGRVIEGGRTEGVGVVEDDEIE